MKKYSIQIKEQMVLDEIKGISKEMNISEEEAIQNMIRGSVYILKSFENIKKLKKAWPIPPPEIHQAQVLTEEEVKSRISSAYQNASQKK